MSTLSDIEATLYDRLGFDSAPATKVTTRLRRFINETQRQIIATRGCSKIRRRVLPFSTVANTPFAVLPQSAVNIITIQDRVNQWVLDPVSIEDLRAEDPGLVAASSFPNRYVILNYAAPVAQDPTAACELFAVSTAGGDGATKTVMIEGITTGGYYRSASVALNGGNPVSLGAAITDWIGVTKFYIAPSSGTTLVNATGNITLTQGLAGAELGRIPIGRAFARYTRLHMHPTPSAIGTYYADVDLHIDDMSSLADEPYLPEDWHWMLVSGALMKEFQRRKQPVEYGEEKQAFKDGMSGLKLFLSKRSGVALGLNRKYRMRFSQLGANFPVGT